MLTIGLACVCHDAVVLPPVCSAPVHQSVPSSYACWDGYCFLQALAQVELGLGQLICVPAYRLRQGFLDCYDCLLSCFWAVTVTVPGMASVQKIDAGLFGKGCSCY